MGLWQGSGIIRSADLLGLALGYSKGMSEHDTTELEALGRRRQRLIVQLADLDAQLKPLIFAAAQAEVEQVRIVRWTGMARESIRLASLTPEQRQATRDKRKPGAKLPRRPEAAQ